MDLIRNDELLDLAELREGPCLSIFIPTVRATAETLQNPTRLKNQIRQAERLLEERSVRSTHARELLEPLRDLLDRFEFWQHQSDGLALFRAPGFFRYYRLPVPFRDAAYAGNRFHTKPLLRMLGAGKFFVLAVGQHALRLLEGTRHTIQELPLPEDMPDFAFNRKAEERAKALQYHTVGPRSSGGTSAVYHGQGGVEDEIKEQLQHHFREVDRVLKGVLRDSKAPMVLAGVDYELAIYRSVSSYPRLVEAGIHGNSEECPAAELYRKALEIVAPLLDQAETTAAARFAEAAAKNQGSNDLQQIVPEAHHGRIESLFVAVGIDCWGRYDPETDEVELTADPTPADDDMLDLAAIQTLARNGTVFAVPPERVPGSGPAAALYRY